MVIQQYVVGPVQTNCWFLINDDTREVLIVDPGDAPAALALRISSQQLLPRAILLTHGHFDHAGAAEELAEEYEIPIYALQEERRVLEDPRLNLSGAMGVGIGGQSISYHVDQWLSDGQTMRLAGLRFTVLHTPGHTPGGCCFYFADEGVLISGDTLFAGSVGRTDFPEGSMSDLVRAIHEKLLILPDETEVLPGHGESTTIGEEKQYNPFL